MQASVEERENWVKEARRQKAQYVLIVCDTFSYEQYPVYCKDNNDLANKKYEYAGKNMQRVEGEIKVSTAKRIVANRDKAAVALIQLLTLRFNSPILKRWGKALYKRDSATVKLFDDMVVCKDEAAILLLYYFAKNSLRYVKGGTLKVEDVKFFQEKVLNLNTLHMLVAARFIAKIKPPVVQHYLIGNKTLRDKILNLYHDNKVPNWEKCSDKFVEKVRNLFN